MRGRILGATVWFGAVLLAVVSFAQPAIAADQPGAAGGQFKDNGMNWRETLAVDFVKERLKTAYPTREFKVTVHPTLVQYPGNKQRPITGNRPVGVDWKAMPKKANGTQRLLNRLFSKNNQRWYVQVQKGEVPAIVEQKSMGLLARIDERTGLRMKAHDLINSEGARRAALSGLTGLALTKVNLAAAGAVAMYAVRELTQGISRRNEARKSAVDATAKWASELMTRKEKPVTPSPVETFEHYKQQLQTIKPGTSPGDLHRFLNALSSHTAGL